MIDGVLLREHPAYRPQVDETELDERVEERASALLAAAYADSAAAYDLLDYGNPSETLADILPLVTELREPASCLTAEERIDRFVYRVDRLIREYATNAAEMERDDIERAMMREERT